jgi:prophage antirepressor-like protein
MNTELQTFQFGDVNVAVIDHNQERWMTGEDIGVALEYNHPRDSITNIFEA